MKIELKEILSASPAEVFEAWLNSDKHSEMTGSAADIKPVVGYHFKALDGYISGENLEIKPNSYIKQTWRSSDFTDNQPDSILEIKLKPIDGGKTELNLIHSELDDNDEQYRAGWEEYYFKPMRTYFK